jgi:hypothetical protein
VVWVNDKDPDPNWISGRLFNADGTPATDGGYWPDVTVDSQGRFVVTWKWIDVKGRMLSADGTLLGSEEFLLSIHDTFFNLGHPMVSAAPDGQFVAAWHSNGSTGNDNDSYSIQARRFAGFIGVFIDGFETGDTTAWSDSSAE